MSRGGALGVNVSRAGGHAFSITARTEGQPLYAGLDLSGRWLFCACPAINPT
jgi:hypothetical protein